MSINIDAALRPPLLKQIVHNANILEVAWEPPPGSGNFFSIVLFEDDRPILSGNTYGSSGILPAEGIDTERAYTVKVAQTDPAYSRTGPFSNGIGLINSAPAGIRAAYNGSELDIAWDPPANRPPVRGGRVSLYEKSQSKLISTTEADGFEILLKPVPPLNPALEYFITVAAANPGSVGPDSPPADIIQKTPRISGAVYTGTAIDATAALQAVSSLELTLYLYEDGELIRKSEPSAEEHVVLSLDEKLAVWRSYEVRMAYAAGGSRGPESRPMAILPGIPVLRSVSYDGTGIKASWSSPPGSPVPTGGTMQLFQGDVPMDSIDVIGCEGLMEPGQALDPGKAYDLRIAASLGPSRGAFSAPMPMISSVRHITFADYDGERVAAVWPVGKAYGVSRYILSLIYNGIAIAAQNADEGKGVLNCRLDPGGGYSLSLRAAGENLTGPATGVPIVSSIPVIKQVKTLNGAIHAILDGRVPEADGAAGLTAFLYRDGEIVAGPVEARGDPPSVTFYCPLQSPGNYYVKARAEGAKSSGPLSDAAEAILGVPVIETVDCLETTVSVRWSAVNGRAAAGYLAILDNYSTEKTFTYPCESAYASFPAVHGCSYGLRVRAAGGKASGMDSRIFNFTNEKPELTSVYYDGSFITADWTAPAAPGARFELLLSGGDAVFTSFPANTHHAVIPAALDPEESYSLRARIVRDNFSGPRGRAFAVISAAPDILSVTADAERVVAVIDDTATRGRPGITHYQALLFRDGAAVAGPVTADGSPLTAVFLHTVDEARSYSVKVRAAGVNCAGPYAEVKYTISGTPFISCVNYDGVNAFISWNTVSGDTVTGYDVILKEKTGGKTQSFFTTAGHITVAVDPSGSFSVQVRAVGSKTRGTFSREADILNETLKPVSAFYDGRFIHAFWPASVTPGSSFDLLLFSGGDLQASYPAGGNAAVVPADLDPGCAYSLKVRVVRDIAMGPPGGAFALISAAPGILSVTADADSIAVVIDDTATKDRPEITSYQAVLYRGDEPAAGPVTAAGTPPAAVFAYAVEKFESYSVRVRAAGENRSGPFGSPVSCVSEAPVLSYAYYDGSEIKAVWLPVTAAGITGYTAVLTPAAAPGNPVRVDTTGTSAALPLDFAGASGTYSLRVRAFRGNSAGPFSIPADPVGPGFCLSAEREKAPFLIPAAGPLPPGPFELACLLPELYKNAPQQPPSSGPFVLTALSGEGDFRYKLSLSPRSTAWSFDSSPVRPALLQDYQRFLLLLEGKAPGQEPSTAGDLLPGALQTVIGQIGRILPQTFAETLYYNCGLSPEENYVDLRAGMRLRVEYQQWQTVGASPPQYVNGYTGSGAAEYDIGSCLNGAGSLCVGFNSFLSSLYGLSVPAPAGGGSGPSEGGGGIIDLFFSDFQRPFCRLFYPSAFKAASNPGSGYPKDNAMILAAADWSTLSDITEKITGGVSIPSSGMGYALHYMRGRTVLTPLICICINSSPQWVPVGTTLSQVLEQRGVRPYGIPASIRGLHYTRLPANMYDGASGQTPQFIAGLSVPVRFQWGKSVIYGNSSSWFSLPVLQGDHIVFAGRTS